MNQPRREEVAQLVKQRRLHVGILLVVCNISSHFFQFDLFHSLKIYKLANSLVTQNGRGSGFEPGWGYEFFSKRKKSFFGKEASAGHIIASALVWGARSSIV